MDLSGIGLGRANSWHGGGGWGCLLANGGRTFAIGRLIEKRAGVGKVGAGFSVGEDWIDDFRLVMVDF